MARRKNYHKTPRSPGRPAKSGQIRETLAYRQSEQYQTLFRYCCRIGLTTEAFDLCCTYPPRDITHFTEMLSDHLLRIANDVGMKETSHARCVFLKGCVDHSWTGRRHCLSAVLLVLLFVVSICFLFSFEQYIYCIIIYMKLICFLFTLEQYINFVMKSLLNQIKKRRLQLRLKQHDMMLRIGISRQQYQRLESKGNPRLDTLNLVAKGLSSEVLLIPKEKLNAVKAVLGGKEPDAQSFRTKEGKRLSDDPWQNLLGDSE